MERLRGSEVVYGYTVADVADIDVFFEVVEFVKNQLGYYPDSDVVADVDGSIYQSFKQGEKHLSIECDKKIDYVAIVSDSELQITCLHKWRG